MKRYLLFYNFLLVFTIQTPLQAQLTIERCQELAKANHPIIQRHQIIGKTAEYNLSNAAKGYLPQLMVLARATYQSDVTAIPIQIPGIQIDGLSKDQYQATIDISQSLWDGGAVNAQKELVKAGEAVEQEQLKVDLYALEKRVNQLFFGVLLWEAQIAQNLILQAELQRSYALVYAYQQNGVANQADVDAVSVERLRCQQQYQQLLSGRMAYIEMLGVMIGQSIDESVTFVKPNPDHILFYNQMNRPEMRLFDAQNRLFETQKSALLVGYMPRFNLFVQGGYGRPGLNMLKRDFAPFAIGGIRMAWNFGALYTRKNDLRKIELNQQNVEVLRETFLYYTNIDISQQNIQIERIRKMMLFDDEMIVLRERIRQAAEAKVANGTISVSELMRELHAEHLAKQEKSIHEIELITAIYDLKYNVN
ncbi:MAG: TolC family protein [Prevotellaceae bacterium]|jgi:outer membrane protein TolC|nr:TolC family protein [Prevotellaceae bacterium]